jgi:septal ring factor EnvC (AmiA/AmiB activator)
MSWRSGIGVVLLVIATSASSGRAGAQPFSDPSDPGARLAALDGQIAETLGRIEAAEARRRRVDAEIAGLGERRAAAQRRLRTRARALYRISRAGVLPVAGGFEALLGHLGRLDRMKRMVRSDLGSLRALGRRGEALRAETGRAAEEAEAGRRELVALEQRKQALEQDAQTADQFAAAFASSAPGAWGARPVESGYGMIRVVDEAPEPVFAAERGRLALPVGGASQVRDGRREDGPGLEFVVAPGATVRAVADGRIAFSDTYGSYGRLVIVDHGDEYYTVYGGLGSVEVRVGDELGRGARIGDVAGDQRALFFEVRRGTRTLNARDWLGI